MSDGRVPRFSFANTYEPPLDAYARTPWRYESTTIAQQDRDHDRDRQDQAQRGERGRQENRHRRPGRIGDRGDRGRGGGRQGGWLRPEGLAELAGCAGG